MVPLIGALDVGTSTVACYLLASDGSVRGYAKTNVLIHFPKLGHIEIKPDELWESCLKVIYEAINASGAQWDCITGFGISCQRNTFMTWNRKSGIPYHNFITWKDLRADHIVKELNSSFSLKLFKFFSKIIYGISRKKRYLAGSLIHITNTQIAPRLLWVLRNKNAVLEDIRKDEVAFGTIDTWLLYKLTDGLTYVTDYSNASATGLFDPFTLRWADWAFQMFGIPKKIFPEVVDNAGSHFGHISQKYVPTSIPIYSCMADQSASVFGSCCFNQGDAKITLGTGTFFDLNTGTKPLMSYQGVYPLVGWKVANDTTYIAEAASNDTGVLVKWTQDLEIINNPSESSGIAESVSDNDDVYFVPAFSGLQAPLNDPLAAAGFIGLKPTTRKPHIIRAVLESIVYSIFYLFTVFKKEANLTLTSLKVDGGVANNDFILQMLANIIGIPIKRPLNTDKSAFGAAFMAGLISGFWKTRDELLDVSIEEKTFLPTKSTSINHHENYSRWLRAVERFSTWYSTP